VLLTPFVHRMLHRIHAEEQRRDELIDALCAEPQFAREQF
jgi:hypothetical protein